MEQQPNWGDERRIFEFSGSHTHPLGLLWMNDHLVAKSASLTQNKNNMPSELFEPAIPANKKRQNYA